MKPAIIVFTGLPGTGKTTLSRQVAEALRIPLVAKDAIKEIMFDTIGWSDNAFSAKLAHATFGIMDHITEQLLKNGGSIILEANYFPKLASDTFQHWQQKYHCTIIQVVCRTDIDVLATRYFERQRADRHPGHNDTGSAEDYRATFQARLKNCEDQPLEVAGPVQIVDTTDFNAVDAKNVASWIRLQRK